MNLTKQSEDLRGKIISISAGKSDIHIVEIKKGYARGGHSHPYLVTLFIIIGKVQYKEQDSSGLEIVNEVEGPKVITISAHHPHLLLALEDSFIAEIFSEPYVATEFPPYRSAVNEKMTQ